MNHSWINYLQLNKLGASMPRLCFISTFIFLGLVLSPSWGQAQNSAPGERKVTEAAPAKPPPQKPKKKPKVLRFDDLTIAGELQTPQVYYLLNRKQIVLGHEPSQRDLLKHIEDTIIGEPF